MIDNLHYSSETKSFSTKFIKRKSNGKWGIISNKTGLWWGQTDDKPLGTDYESEDKAKAALRAYHANK